MKSNKRNNPGETNSVPQIEYITIGLLIGNQARLLTCLAELGLTPEVYTTPQPLRNYKGQTITAQQTPIILRADKAGVQYDIGFQRNKRGLFELVTPRLYGMGTANYGQRWGRELVSRYIARTIKEEGVESAEGRAALEMLRASQVNYRLAIDLLCQEWVASRDAGLESLIVNQQWVGRPPTPVGLYTALKLGLPERVEFSSPPTVEEMTALVEATYDADSQIVRNAQAFLQKLLPARLDVVATAWLQNHSPALAAVLRFYPDYLPAQPAQLRLLVALLQDRTDLISTEGAEIVEPLLSALTYPDEAIQARALETLGRLSSQAAREELCQKYIEETLPESIAALLIEKGYRPQDLTRRSLFYFLSRQWEAYDALDFDQRLLRLFYQTTNDQDLRRRLGRLIQQAGRVEYLDIISGSTSLHQTTGQSSWIIAEEAAVLVELLAAQAAWPRLWELIAQLPLEWSIKAVQRLAQAGWQPPEVDHQVALAELSRLVAEPMTTDAATARQTLSQALLRAKVRVLGRVNNLAFAHQGARLALATANRKVLIWDLDQAAPELVLSDFHYPVGGLAFLPDDTLVWAESPAINGAKAGVFARLGGDGRFYRRLGQLEGAVTALQALKSRSVLSISRDGKVRQWHPHSETYVELPRRAAGWNAAICLAGDGATLALLHNQLDLYRLVGEDLLEWQAGSSLDLTNSLKCGAFNPDGSLLATGRFHGELTLWDIGPAGTTQRLEARPATFQGALRSGTTVENLTTLATDDLLLMATSDGCIQFIDWYTMQTVAQIEAGGEKLTSVHISPDGHFMAVGDRNSHFTLWDLRPLSVYRLFAEPLGRARPAHLAALAALPNFGLGLAQPLQNTLKFIETVLLYFRFRFDIELGDLSQIEAGEYDIVVED